MKILVTGGFGYAGSIISDFLLDAGFSVRLFARQAPDFLHTWGERFEVVIGDVTKETELLPGLQGVDAVVHCAALNETNATNAEDAFRVNALGTKAVLDASKKMGVNRVIKMSTFHVYGRPQTELVTESTPACPLTNYSQSQYFAEIFCRQFARENNMEAIVLRCSNGYGVPVHPKVNRWTLAVSDFCRQAMLNNKIVLKSSGMQKRDFVLIRDVAAFIKTLLLTQKSQLAEFRNGHGITFNVGGDKTQSIREIAELVAATCRSEFSITPELQIPNTEGAEILNNFKFDVGKAKKIGYAPTDSIRKEIKNLLLFCTEHAQDIRNIGCLQ